MRVSEIQQQVGRGEYQVDTHAVAEAIVRRMILQEQAAVPAPRAAAQHE
jgi:anti-sigma28 factor (negative regulator of flagellin synthesis)